ncbi:MAG: hypothetical protein ACE5KT_00290 [Methanosarcinales archaeon]
MEKQEEIVPKDYVPKTKWVREIWGKLEPYKYLLYPEDYQEEMEKEKDEESTTNS